MHCHYIIHSDLMFTQKLYICQMLNKFEKQVDHLMEHAMNELCTKIPTWT